jgi:hypothetical protein
MSDRESDRESDTVRVVRRLAAAGITVGEPEAGRALAASREAEAAPTFRGLSLDSMEPMAVFDPRWHR